ncbi:inositol monophosphatase family protein [Nocardioides yefusunii]|uniref:Inositol monophosphatase family protein n=1 Tax=Nocardioides yefusunii TaxID=2500546 RepID=A0ABW1QYR9_9ACTN|nr:inositol monophosphatase [Nocardioides yefusunii]
MDPTDGHLSDAALAHELVAVGVSTARGLWAQACLDPARTKSNRTDVVTRADTAAEAAMVALLAARRPDDAVVGEEGAFRPGCSGRTWVLDPVDGTYNFTRGSQRWCSAAALVVDGVPVLGAVASVSGADADAQVWVGGSDVALTESGRPVPRLVDVTLADSCLLTYLHPPHHATAVGAAWRRLMGGVATWRSTGSGSLDATDVAAARADLSVQHSVPLWDSAPGEALVRSVGGTSARIEADGVEWFLLGAPRAVAEAATLLRGE